MPVILLLCFGVFSLMVVVALASKDRTLRRILWFSILVGLALVAWWSTLPQTDITNSP